MRLQLPAPRRADPAQRACPLCLGQRRVPYVGNHFDTWMVPCPACTGHAPGTAATATGRTPRTPAVASTSR